MVVNPSISRQKARQKLPDICSLAIQTPDTGSFENVQCVMQEKRNHSEEEEVSQGLSRPLRLREGYISSKATQQEQ